MSEFSLPFERWEFGALDIHHPQSSTLKEYFELIPKLEDIPGNIVELGVARGRSLITTGLILKSLNSSKTVLGLDSFQGFPEYFPEDDFENFEVLRDSNLISAEHFERVIRNAAHVKARGGDVHPSQISSSLDFSNTSIQYVQSRIEYLGLKERISLRVGDFSIDIDKLIEGEKFSLVLLDSDLFKSYANTLPALWNQLSPGGLIYLDEYYSLKFPGPRMAVNSFMQSISNGKLIQLPSWMEFERWAIEKNF
jgi:hypothetical protein